MPTDLSNAGPVALFGMLVALLPVGVAVLYAFRPSEHLLALLRPLSLATIFAALNTFLSGMAAVARLLPKYVTPAGVKLDWLAHMLTETITPMFVAFGCLAAAWLCVAVGMIRRQR